MGFRDVLAHQYFSVDPEQVLWISRQAMPQLRLEILLMIQQLTQQHLLLIPHQGLNPVLKVAAEFK